MDNYEEVKYEKEEYILKEENIYVCMKEKKEVCH